MLLSGGNTDAGRVEVCLHFVVFTLSNAVYGLRVCGFEGLRGFAGLGVLRVLRVLRVTTCFCQWMLICWQGLIPWLTR